MGTKDSNDKSRDLREKNKRKKRLIIERVEGYMKRAEELRTYLNKQASR